MEVAAIVAVLSAQSGMAAVPGAAAAHVAPGDTQGLHDGHDGRTGRHVAHASRWVRQARREALRG
jgi:hypothetical protein